MHQCKKNGSIDETFYIFFSILNLFYDSGNDVAILMDEEEFQDCYQFFG